jgi:hypothetical protein
MIDVRAVAVTSAIFVVGVQPLYGQDLSRYRQYALASSVASVVGVSGARESDRTLRHERPARIEEIAWRVPYRPATGEPTDPVRDVLFSFYDDQLYRVAVTYDRDRMEGLTNDDVIESVSAVYGVPLLRYAKPVHRAAARDMVTDTADPADISVVAQWEDAASLLTLTRSTYWPEFQLVLVSKPLSAQARDAITEARRLDAQEAPQRELEQRKQAEADAREAGRKARVENKPAFRP